MCMCCKCAIVHTRLPKTHLTQTIPICVQALCKTFIVTTHCVELLKGPEMKYQQLQSSSREEWAENGFQRRKDKKYARTEISSRSAYWRGSISVSSTCVFELI